MFNEKPYPLPLRFLYSTREDWRFNEHHQLKGRNSLQYYYYSGKLGYLWNNCNIISEQDVLEVQGSIPTLQKSEAQTNQDTDLAQICPNRYQPSKTLKARTPQQRFEFLLTYYYSRYGLIVDDATEEALNMLDFEDGTVTDDKLVLFVEMMNLILQPHPDSHQCRNQVDNKSKAPLLNLEDIYNVGKYPDSETFSDLTPHKLMVSTHELVWDLLELPHDEPVSDEDLLEVDAITADLLLPYLDKDTIANLIQQDNALGDAREESITTDPAHSIDHPPNSLLSNKNDDTPTVNNPRYDSTRVSSQSKEKHEDFLRLYSKFAPIVNKAVLEVRNYLSLTEDDILTEEQILELEEELTLYIRQYLDAETRKKVSAMVECAKLKSALSPSPQVAVLKPDWLLRPPPEPPPDHEVPDCEDLCKLCWSSTSTILTPDRSTEETINTKLRLLDSQWG